MPKTHAVAFPHDILLDLNFHTEKFIAIRCMPPPRRPMFANSVWRSAPEPMEQILSFLYGASGITAAALYAPQILKYRRDPAARRAIALLSWAGWIAIAGVTVRYALCVVKSYLFAAIAGLNAAAQLTVPYCGVRERFASAWRAAACAPPDNLLLLHFNTAIVG